MARMNRACINFMIRHLKVEWYIYYLLEVWNKEYPLALIRCRREFILFWMFLGWQLLPWIPMLEILDGGVWLVVGRQSQKSVNAYRFALALLHYGQRQFALLLGIGTIMCLNDILLIYCSFIKEICWSSRKSVILRHQLNKNIKFTMLQRRMNNWNTVSNRGIKCFDGLSCVHTSGIVAFYFRDIFRRTFDRPSGIRWCRYPAETINENRRRVLTKLFDGFCFVPVGDVRTMRSSPSIPSTGWIIMYY